MRPRLGPDRRRVLFFEFERGQHVFSLHDREKVRDSKHLHFLRGVLARASCGSALYSLTARGPYGYFYCLGRFTRRTQCREPYVGDACSRLQ